MPASSCEAQSPLSFMLLHHLMRTDCADPWIERMRQFQGTDPQGDLRLSQWEMALIELFLQFTLRQWQVDEILVSRELTLGLMIVVSRFWSSWRYSVFHRSDSHICR